MHWSMAKLSLPQGEGVQCMIARCLRFLCTVTKSIISMVGSEITLLHNWSGRASHHTEQHIHCIFLSKELSVASCSAWHPVTFLFEGLPEHSDALKQIKIVHGLKYFPQVTMTVLLDWLWLKAPKLGEFYVVLQPGDLDVSFSFLEGHWNNT